MQITENDIWRFTKGDCHVLAKRLHRVAGLSLHCLVNEEGKYTRHAFVMLGNKVLDVEGLWDKRDFKRRWLYANEKTIHISEPLSIGWFKENWRPKGTQFGKYSYLRARKIANHLLNEYVH